MKDFDKILKELKSEIPTLIKEIFGSYIKEAVSDAEEFITALQKDISNWLKEYHEGRLSKEELESLIRGKKSLAEMHRLKHKGIIKTKIDKFTNIMVEKLIEKIKII